MTTEIIWITNPDNYDPQVHDGLKVFGQRRIDLFAARGYQVRVVHLRDVVAGWDGRPRLWSGGEDLLDPPRGFMMASWSWAPGAAEQFRVIARTIRASRSVLLTEGLDDPERLGADKLAQYQHAGGLGVPVLPAVAVPAGRYARRALEIAEKHFHGSGYVVKPRELAMGFGVLKADTLDQLAAATDLLAASGLPCIVQPYFPNTGDLRVFVHRGRTVAGLLRLPAGESYRANMSEGGLLGEGGDPPPEIAEMSERIATTVGAGYLAVDWLLADGGPVFNEWMGIAAGFEDLGYAKREVVADALFAHIGERLASVSNN